MFKPKNKKELIKLLENENIKIKDIDTSLVGSFKNLFRNSKRKDIVDVKYWKTNNVENMSGMFYDVEIYDDVLDLTNWNFEKVIKTDLMFRFSNIKCIKFPENLNFENLVSARHMFAISNFVDGNNINLKFFPKLKDVSFMFYVSNTKKIDFSEFEAPNVEEMKGMFKRSNFEIIDLKKFTTRKVKNMESLFSECDNLKKLNISSFDTKNVENMRDMFSFLNIEELNLKHFNTRNVKKFNSMFNSSAIKNLDLTSFDFKNANNLSCMFCCSNIENLKICFENVNDNIKTDSMFYDLTAKEVTILKNNFKKMNFFTTSNIENLYFDNNKIEKTIKLLGKKKKVRKEYYNL